MRILMVTRALPFHGLGGMEAVAWDYARAFRDAGHEVMVLTVAHPSLPLDGQLEGIRIATIGTRHRRYSATWWRKTACFLKVKPGAFDVVLSVGRGARTMVPRRRAGGPVFVLQAHGTSWGELVSKWRQRRVPALLKSAVNLLGIWEDRLFRRFDAVISVGELVDRDLKRAPTRWIMGDVPVHLVENGVAAERFSFDPQARSERRATIGLPDGARAILCASRLHPQKGVMEAMEGFLLAAAVRPELHLLVAGAGPDEARLKARAGASGAADRIHFLGMVPRGALREYLSAADMFLFTSMRAEVGATLSVLEALAAGLPVVVSSQVISARFEAITVDPRAADSVADGILAGVELTPTDRLSRLPDELNIGYSVNRYIGLFNRIISANRSTKY